MFRKKKHLLAKERLNVGIFTQFYTTRNMRKRRALYTTTYKYILKMMQYGREKHHTKKTLNYVIRIGTKLLLLPSF